jgi:hypothetical protein
MLDESKVQSQEPDNAMGLNQDILQSDYQTLSSDQADKWTRTKESNAISDTVVQANRKAVLENVLKYLPPDVPHSSVVAASSKGVVSLRLTEFRGIQSISLTEYAAGFNRNTFDFRLSRTSNVNLPCNRDTIVSLLQAVAQLARDNMIDPVATIKR